ncbi:MAG: hypothetical protein Q7U60_07830, partial [Candidatus Methanoperedens sp.]|nr:hypothetical protein [Candidatus Methanoperedens sp.]
GKKFEMFHPAPPILLSHLRERRGGRRRGILSDIGCMGISCAAIFMVKLDKNNLCTSVPLWQKIRDVSPSPPHPAVTPAGKKRRTEARYFD